MLTRVVAQLSLRFCGSNKGRTRKHQVATYFCLFPGLNKSQYSWTRGGKNIGSSESRWVLSTVSHQMHLMFGMLFVMFGSNEFLGELNSAHVGTIGSLMFSWPCSPMWPMGALVFNMVDFKQHNSINVYATVVWKKLGTMLVFQDRHGDYVQMSNGLTHVFYYRYLAQSISCHFRAYIDPNVRCTGCFIGDHGFQIAIH